MATVLVQRGTLQVGDAVVSGSAFARVRAMVDENGRPLKEAGPAKPALVQGWSHVPEAGDEFRVVSDEKEARHIAQERETRHRAAELATAGRTQPSLAELLTQARRGELPVLNLIVKADVQGSLEAIVDAPDKLPQDEVRVDVLHRGVGGITENDVSLAMASGAVVVGFNVRPDTNARTWPRRRASTCACTGSSTSLHDDVRAALGDARPGAARGGAGDGRGPGAVPGAEDGHGCRLHGDPRGHHPRVPGQAGAGRRHRVHRSSGLLRRFKDNVGEVAEGFECGIGPENFQDVHEGDVIEAYEVREVARTLALLAVLAALCVLDLRIPG